MGRNLAVRPWIHVLELLFAVFRQIKQAVKFRIIAGFEQAALGNDRRGAVHEGALQQGRAVLHVVVEGQKEGQPGLSRFFKIQEPVPRELFLKPQQQVFARGIKRQQGRNRLQHAKLVKTRNAG